MLPLFVSIALLFSYPTSSVGLGSSVLPRESRAQDPAKLAPQFYKLVLDNEQVRVIDYHLKPGEKEPLNYSNYRSR